MLWERGRRRFVEKLAYLAGARVAAAASEDDQRRPIAWLSEVFFLGMVEELERRGVSRKATADMLGVRLRTLQRQLVTTQASKNVGTNKWNLLLARLRTPQTRDDILSRFPRSEHRLIRGLLVDMVNTGWLHTDEEGRLGTASTPSWSDAMLDEYLTAEVLLGERTEAGALDPGSLAQETGVPQERWRVAIERQTTPKQDIYPSHDEATYTSHWRLLPLLFDALGSQHNPVPKGTHSKFLILPTEHLDQEERAMLRAEFVEVSRKLSEIHDAWCAREPDGFYSDRDPLESIAVSYTLGPYLFQDIAETEEM